MNNNRILLLVSLLVVLMPISVWAETEEEGVESSSSSIVELSPMISYQGRLLDSSSNPITGVVSMTFRLYDASTGGTLQWTETKNVQVTNGLFNTQLGSVTPLPVSKFNQRLWLEIVAGVETLTPRQQLLGAPYAFSLVPGARVYGSLSTPLLTVNNSNMHGIEGKSYNGDGVRGISYGGGVADNGVYGETDSTSSGEAGVYGRSTGNAAGVYGRSTDGAGVHGRSTNDYGVYGSSTNDHGIYGVGGSGYGDYGGYFEGYNGVYGDGYFGVSGNGSYGVYGTGRYIGVYGYSKEGQGVYAYSNGDDGVRAYSYGTSSGDDGVDAYSKEGRGVYGRSYNGTGVYGYSSNNIGVRGIGGSGTGDYGGYFTSNGYRGLYAKPYGTYYAAYLDGNIYVNGNIYKSGSNSFVEDHPTDKTKEIVYVCLEGGENGVYTRGSAQLKNGEATVKLPDHFSLVASSEGLTVQVTPTEDSNGLYVASKSPTEIVVKELGGGTSGATFDYLVNGIRKGYEDYEAIQDKDPERSDPGLAQEHIEEVISEPMPELVELKEPMLPEGE